MPEKDLPVLLPDQAEFTGTGESPLAGGAEFVNTTCPKCDGAGDARNGHDGHVRRFVVVLLSLHRSAQRDDAVRSGDRVAYWTPVDQYIGGDSHAVMHLIYTRFWTKVMRDLGLVNFNEPVKRLLTQGMVTNRVEEHRRMEGHVEELGNGVDPDEMIEAYGADAARLFVLFAAPPENELRWLETGIEGAVRFLQRVYDGVSVAQARSDRLRSGDQSKPERATDFSDRARALRRKTHQTIARVTDDSEKLHFNTNVAALMELSNALGEFDVDPATASDADVFAVREALEALVVMLTPFSPHIAEEMWEGLGHEGGVLQSAQWPSADPELAKKDELEIPVQVNGKLRSRVVVSPDISEADLRALALADAKVQSFIDGHQIVKVIVVPQRLVNVVIK